MSSERVEERVRLLHEPAADEGGEVERSALQALVDEIVQPPLVQAAVVLAPLEEDLERSSPRAPPFSHLLPRLRGGAGPPLSLAPPSLLVLG